ncbi:hypothetical protein [Vreelandella neptunia]|uniref:Uncharacterized protein n=1 Tax=Vreelandella neptunia TaxID=115551 RepID=A0ABZ0YRH6_9GAMM|nr:hypothetical protein [Halomonas neptunia]MDN3561699.1 hypothetical protein [Halomonas neptunia]WQH14601.1 hypothetical protein SR894_08690 [Halomonas neptunia]
MRNSTALILAGAGHVAASIVMQFLGIEGADLKSTTGVLLVGMGLICMEIQEAGRK